MNKQNEQIISARQARDILNKPTNFIVDVAMPEIKKALKKGDGRCGFKVYSDEPSYIDVLFLEVLGYKVSVSDLGWMTISWMD